MSRSNQLLRLICWKIAGLMVSGVWPADLPSTPSTYWDEGTVVAVARPNWIYYHVTLLPKDSVLYLPTLPDSPRGYADWPSLRLVKPEVVVQGDRSMLRDPVVERSREKQVRGSMAGWMEGWSAVCQRISSGWRNLIPWGAAPPPKDYLFSPPIDPEFLGSTLYRYLPPDQFWQIFRSSLILVRSADEASLKQRAVEQGRQEHKMVLQLSPNQLDRTPLTESFWQPWTVFIPPAGPKAVEITGRSGTIPSGLRVVEEPDRAASQLHRKWHLIRETDLASGRWIETLVDCEGEMKVPWSLSVEGSRFDVWTIPWGTVQGSLVNSWTLQSNDGLAGVQTVRLTSSRPDYVANGQSYEIGWTGTSTGESRLQIWNLNLDGQPLESPQSFAVDHLGARVCVANNMGGSTVFVLWKRTHPKNPWTRLAQWTQPIRPLPEARLEWIEPGPVLLTHLLEFSGRFFPGEAPIQIVAEQSGRQKVVRELTGRSDWTTSFSPAQEGLRSGPTVFKVQYSAPWTSTSELPDTWKKLTALRVHLDLIPSPR